MLIDHASNFVSLVRIGRIFEHAALRHLLFSEVHMLVESRRNHRIKHIVVTEICSPVTDRDVIRSSIDFAVSTSLIRCIVRGGSE